MYYNEITEEMWDKIEAEGVVVLKSSNDKVNFAINYRFNTEDEWFPHIGDELESDLVGRLVTGEGWGKTWNVVERPTSMIKQSTFTNCTVSKDPVVEWLDKYQQVVSTNYHIGKINTSDYGVCLTTDHGDILGSNQIVDFINNRYDLLQKEAKSNKQKELAEKKVKLLEELSAIDKELEGV